MYTYDAEHSDHQNLNKIPPTVIYQVVGEGIQWGEGLQRVGLHSSAGAAGEGDRIRELYTTNEEDLLHVHVKKLICNIHQGQVTDVHV